MTVYELTKWLMYHGTHSDALSICDALMNIRQTTPVLTREKEIIRTYILTNEQATELGGWLVIKLDALTLVDVINGTSTTEIHPLELELIKEARHGKV